MVQHNRAIFEPDGDAINEALENLRSFGCVPANTFDPINDQENEDLKESLPANPDKTDLFNEMLPTSFARS